jgi:hypothetical protein
VVVLAAALLVLAQSLGLRGLAGVTVLGPGPAAHLAQQQQQQQQQHQLVVVLLPRV